MAKDSNRAAAGSTRAEQGQSAGSFVRFLIILAIATFLVRSLLIAPFSIPSGSMLPNLLIGDYLFVAKWPYGYSRFSFPFGVLPFEGRVFGSLPERGDIVVFRYPGARNEDLIKRVIGLPGDRIEMRAGALIINGQPVTRERIADFVVPVSPNSPCRSMGETGARTVTDAAGQRVCAYPRVRETLPGGRAFDTLDQLPSGPGDNIAPVTVAQGHVLVMGDNRDDSLDGRFPQAVNGVGQLPVTHIQGRALVGFFSTDGSARWLLPWTWFSAARWERVGQLYP